MKKEVNSVLGIIIIVIVSALICFLTLVIVGAKKEVAENNPSNDKNTPEQNEVKYEKIENIDVIAKEFYDNFISSNKLLFFNYNNVFKKGNKFNVSDLSLNDKMLITYAYCGINSQEVSAEDFKNRYVKLFGSSGYQNINFSGGFCYCQAGLEIVYDSNSNKFIKKASVEGCGSGPYNEEYLYDKVEQVEDKIQLYIRFGYTIPDTTAQTVNANKIILYSDPERKNIVASNIDVNNIVLYKDKLNTLIYTLVKDNTTNNYVLESIEVVK